jgi:hypothetical protein
VDDELTVEPDDIPGGWANFARVIASGEEFTVDFLRLDPFAPGTAARVARISGTAPFLARLVDELERVWQTWASEMMPPEVQGDDG